MIRTEFTRQVAIKHWLPEYIQDSTGTYVDGDKPQLVTTGYKQQRAWCKSGNSMEAYYLIHDAKCQLLAGEEVDGFVWKDEPIIGLMPTLKTRISQVEMVNMATGRRWWKEQKQRLWIDESTGKREWREWTPITMELKP